MSFFRRNELDSKEFTALSKALLDVERRISSLEIKVDAVDSRLKAISGRVYQMRQGEQVEESKDSYTPLTPFG